MTAHPAPDDPSPIDLIGMFRANVPDTFLRDAMREVLKGWQDADRDCREKFEEPERHDLFPIQRRANIERGLRIVARRHGFSGTPEKNNARTSSYSRIICNGVILTASAVREPHEIVRHAEFRLTIARSSQASLFEESLPIIPDSPLYALLLHGPGFERNGNGDEVPVTYRPGFVDIVFPAPGAIGGPVSKIEYVGGRIELMKEFSDVLNEGIAVTEEVIGDNIKPKLRKTASRKEAHG